MAVEKTPSEAAPSKEKEVETRLDDTENVPDPDEDDLDDLDDMLDEFSAVKVGTGEGPKSARVPGAPQITIEDERKADELLEDDEFARQLQAGMADLLGGVDNSADMQAQFESIFKDLGAASERTADAQPGATEHATTDAAPGSAAEDTFQETIRRTMERMRASGDQATAAAAATESDDFLAELMKQMQEGGGGLGEEGGEEEFSKMLLGMMEQLTNKEILYEPMKELHDKFPDWLVKNRATTPADDLKRYEEQQVLVKEIVAKFEESTYDDSNTVDRDYIVDRMQKMQAAGSPPNDLVGDMSSAQEALAAPDESCNPQ